MIKFKLVKFEKQLLYQVLEQDLGRNFSFSFNHENYRKIQIASSSYPAINTMFGDLYIYIRGSNINLDNNVYIKYCNSNDERDELYDRILYAFNKMKDEKDKI